MRAIEKIGTVQIKTPRCRPGGGHPNAAVQFDFDFLHGDVVSRRSGNQQISRNPRAIGRREQRNGRRCHIRDAGAGVKLHLIRRKHRIAGNGVHRRVGDAHDDSGQRRQTRRRRE